MIPLVKKGSGRRPYVKTWQSYDSTLVDPTTPFLKNLKMILNFYSKCSTFLDKLIKTRNFEAYDDTQEPPVPHFFASYKK